MRDGRPAMGNGSKIWQIAGESGKGMDRLYSVAAVILVFILLYRFRGEILAALRRFDQRNIARRREEQEDRRDLLAHYKHTMRLAEEQVDDIVEFPAADERTGDKVTRYVFAGETFVSRDEAEAARNEAIVAKARAFYRELPTALASRGNGKLN
jgi:hypothetical protein